MELASDRIFCPPPLCVRFLIVFVMPLLLMRHEEASPRTGPLLLLAARRQRFQSLWQVFPVFAPRESHWKVQLVSQSLWISGRLIRMNAARMHTMYELTYKELV